MSIFKVIVFVALSSTLTHTSFATDLSSLPPSTSVYSMPTISEGAWGSYSFICGVEIILSGETLVTVSRSNPLAGAEKCQEAGMIDEFKWDSLRGVFSLTEDIIENGKKTGEVTVEFKFLNSVRATRTSIRKVGKKTETWSYLFLKMKT